MVIRHGVLYLVVWLAQTNGVIIEHAEPQPALVGGSVTFGLTRQRGDPAEFTVIFTGDTRGSAQLPSMTLSGGEFSVSIPNDESFVGDWTIHAQAAGSARDMATSSFFIDQAVDSQPQSPPPSTNSKTQPPVNTKPTPAPTAGETHTTIGSTKSDSSNSSITGSGGTDAPTASFPQSYSVVGGPSPQSNQTSTLRNTSPPSILPVGAKSTNRHLSAGAIAGIVISLIIALLCAAVCAVLWMKRRRKPMVFTGAENGITNQMAAMPRHPSVGPFLVQSPGGLSGTLAESPSSTKAEMYNFELKSWEENIQNPPAQANNIPLTSIGTGFERTSTPSLSISSVAESPQSRIPDTNQSELPLFITDRQGRTVPIAEAGRVYLEFGIVVDNDHLGRDTSRSIPPSYRSS